MKAKVGEVDPLKARLDAVERTMGFLIWKPSKKERELIMRRARSPLDNYVLLEQVKAELEAKRL